MDLLELVMRRYLLIALALFCNLAFAVVDINTANQTELDRLPGIGPKLAKEIVEYRKKNGPFKSVDELTKVKGIGPKSLEKLRKEVVAGAAGAPAAMPAPPAVKSTAKPVVKQ
jgi:competence protein ComEA